MAMFLAGVPGKLSTLLTRLSSARAGWLDNLQYYTSTKAGYLDTAISSRASAASWTSALATKLNTNVDGKISEIKTVEGNAVSDPRLMRRMWLADESYLKIGSDAYYQGYTSGFLSVVDAHGAYVQMPSAATWYTVCNITGSGYLAHAFCGRTAYATACTQYIRITVDGVARTFSKTQTDQSACIVISAGEANQTNLQAGDWLDGGGSYYLADVRECIAAGFATLRFDTSLKVETYQSTYGSTSVYGGAIYQLD